MMSKRMFLSMVLVGLVGWFGGMSPAFAQGSVIGYELTKESHDTSTNTYTMAFEVWSVDREAQELTVQASSESSNLEILTAKKTWSGKIPKGKRYKTAISARIQGSETLPMVIEINRKAESRTDSKKVTVLVAPR